MATSGYCTFEGGKSYENYNLLDFEEEDMLRLDLEIYNAIKARRLMNLGFPAVKHLFELYGLGDVLQYFEEHNQTTAPYHGKFHSYSMALNCYEGALIQKLPLPQAIMLLIAGLFHDADHTGGAESDDVNIQLAVECLKKAPKNRNTDLLILEAADLIPITKYPYVQDPITITEMIIRDADLMQLYDENEATLRSQYLGLKAEVERSRSVTFTSEQWATGMRSWLKENVHWYTEWASQKAQVLNFEALKERMIRVTS